MFSKKRLIEIKEKEEYLEKLKSELLFIKQNLEDMTPKIDISDLYIWSENGLNSIVRLNVKKIHGRSIFGQEDGYESTLVDIFSNKTIYTKCSVDLITSKQWVDKSYKEGYYAYLTPLHKFDNNILAYADKKVPLYVLQQLYYKLNNVDINGCVLKNNKK